jgi:hypothetical protein
MAPEFSGRKPSILRGLPASLSQKQAGATRAGTLPNRAKCTGYPQAYPGFMRHPHAKSNPRTGTARVVQPWTGLEWGWRHSGHISIGHIPVEVYCPEWDGNESGSDWIRPHAGRGLWTRMGRVQSGQKRSGPMPVEVLGTRGVLSRMGRVQSVSGTCRVQLAGVHVDLYFVCILHNDTRRMLK